MKIYEKFEQAKNGSFIPVFSSGKTMESRYNPERDAVNLCNSIEQDYNFFLVLGIGSGLFIKMLSEKFSEAKIIGLELFNEDLKFLESSDLIKKLEENSNIKLISLEDLENVLSQNYFPAKYGDLKIIEQRAWISENSGYLETIKATLQKSLGIISADYSVQAHFGKIWTSNILNNARIAAQGIKLPQADINKTAAIIAAGPSSDKNISLLNNNDYYIISTDTAASSLIQKNIIPDVIISIDGQNVSYNHFMKCPDTLYVFDLCANFSAASKIISSGHKLLFFCSGHPLSSAINASAGNILPFLFSGAGTVTITALDFAVQAGFKNISIFGADFSYSNGKAYSRGTYLDKLYNLSSSKIESSEKNFSKLLYRTELIKSNNRMTTPILEAYRQSLERYLKEKNISFIKENDIYKLHVTSSSYLNTKLFTTLNYSASLLSAFYKKLEGISPEETETILLPYLAWLRNNKKYKNYSYKELLKLAFNSIVSYNI